MTSQQRTWAERISKAHELLCDVAIEMKEAGIDDNRLDVVVNAHLAAAEADATLNSP